MPFLAIFILYFLAYFHMHGSDRFWRHYRPVAKSGLLPWSLLQHRRPSFLHNYFTTLQTIVFTQFVVLQYILKTIWK